jgi:hypothetical protein
MGAELPARILFSEADKPVTEFAEILNGSARFLHTHTHTHTRTHTHTLQLTASLVFPRHGLGILLCPRRKAAGDFRVSAARFGSNFPVFRAAFFTASSRPLRALSGRRP